MSDTAAPPPRWLDPAERRAWLRVAALIELLPAALDAQLQRDADLTAAGYLMLAMLSEHPERALRMSELAARSNASPSRVSHVVSKLERQGYVRREKCREDGRGQIAVLTDAGWEKVVATAPGHVAKVRELVLDPLTPGQLAQLDTIVARMLDVLDPEGRYAATALAREADGA